MVERRIRIRQDEERSMIPRTRGKLMEWEGLGAGSGAGAVKVQLKCKNKE